MGTLLLLDIPKVPSDSTIQKLLKSAFGMFGIEKLTRLDSDHMCMSNTSVISDLDLNSLLFFLSMYKISLANKLAKIH